MPLSGTANDTIARQSVRACGPRGAVGDTTIIHHIRATTFEQRPATHHSTLTLSMLAAAVTALCARTGLLTAPTEYATPRRHSPVLSPSMENSYCFHHLIGTGNGNISATTY